MKEMKKNVDEKKETFSSRKITAMGKMRKTYGPEVSHGANRLKRNPTATGCIHKQVRHGVSVIVGA